MGRRILAVVAAAIVGIGILGACGSGDAAAPAGATRTVEHFFGTTAAPIAPKRIVTVGYTDDQTLLALGHKPVGMADQYPNPGGASPDVNTQWPWVKQQWGTELPQVVLNNGDDAPNYEKIAALKPDLIVAVYSDIDRTAYDRLAAIAPTLARGKGIADPFGAPWRETIVQIARAVGQEDEARGKLEAIDRQFAAARAANPGFAGQRAVAVSWFKGQAYPFTSTDVRGQVLAGLGFQHSPEIDGLSGGKFSFPLSAERLDAIDLDRVFVINDAAEQAQLRAVPAFQALRVTQANRVGYLLDGDAPSIGAAMSQATLASMPFAIDAVTKAAA